MTVYRCDLSPQDDEATLAAAGHETNKVTHTHVNPSADIKGLPDQALLSALLNSVMVPVVFLDNRGVILQANQICHAQTGAGSSELVGHVFWQAFAVGGDAEHLQRCFEQALETGHGISHVDTLDADGARRRMAWSLSVVAPSGSDASFVLASATDLTEQDFAEQRIQHLNLVLRAIRDVGKLIVGETDRDHLLTSVCQSLIRTRGYYNAWIALWDQSDQFAGAFEAGLGDDFKPMHQLLHSGRRTNCCLSSLASTNVVAVANPHTHCSDCPLSHAYEGRGALSRRLEYGDKVYGVLSVSVPSWMASQSQEHALFAEVADDIGFALHRFELERARERAEARAREHLENLVRVSRIASVGEMASALAHEVNQPLCAISSTAQGCLRLLESGHADEGMVVEALRDLAAQADRAGEIVRRIRGYIKRKPPSRENVDLNDVVRRAVDLVEVEARHKCVSLRAELGTVLPPVQADGIQIEQVVVNLLRNAIEAVENNEPGDRQIVINTNHEPNGCVKVSVSDTGRGLPTEDPNAVFAPFYTTKPEGLGIGLSICRSVVEAHGGRLRAEPNLLRGATFTFVLPRT